MQLNLREGFVVMYMKQNGLCLASKIPLAEVGPACHKLLRIKSVTTCL
jgi:hypothetical protein